MSQTTQPQNLYDKAENMWQTLAGIVLQAEAGIAPDPELIRTVLQANRPTISDKKKECPSLLGIVKEIHSATDEHPYVQKLAVQALNILQPLNEPA